MSRSDIINDLKRSYKNSKQNNVKIGRDFIAPCLKECVRYRRGTGTVTSSSITSPDGIKMLSIDDNGDVHIGNNSMVFTNAENADGVDVMSSTIGKIQIGNNSTDTTTVVGALNVQEPTQDSHAATRAYVDKVGALAAVLDTRLPVGGKNNRLSLNTATIHNKTAIGFSLVGVVKRDSGRLLDYSIGFAISGSESMSKGSLRFSF